MNALYGSTAWIIHAFEGSIPLKSDGCRAGYAGLAWNTLGSRVAGEVFGKYRAVVIFFFVLWRVDGESLCSVCHLLIAYSL